MRYGRAIRTVRAAHGMSQLALADRLSIGPSQLSLIEADKRKPSLEVLHEIAAALEVPMPLLALLASRPEDLNDDADPKYVADLARALLRVLVRVGEQQSLPMKKKKKTSKRPRGRHVQQPA